MTAKKGTVPEGPTKPEETDKVFTFKSKFREDKVALFKTGEKRIDGSIKVVTEWAEFDRNTWTTRDPEKAERLRQIIKERERDRNPLHVFETTDMK